MPTTGKDEGELRVSRPEDIDRPPPPECSQPPPLISPKGRSITPKPLIFSSLGDAHLAITARLASRSAAQTVPHTPFNSRCGSPVNQFDKGTLIGTLPSSRHMEFAANIHVVNGRCLTGYAASTPAIAARSQQEKTEIDDPLPAISAGDHHTSSYDDDFDLERDWINGPGPDINSARAPRETGSTVINIYRQYLPSTILGSSTSSEELKAVAVLHETHNEHKSHPSDSSQGDSSERNYVLAHSPSLETAEIGHPARGTNSAKSRWPMYSAPGDAPSVPLPELPNTQGTAQHSLLPISDDPDFNNSFETHSTDSLSNSQVLLNGLSSIDYQESKPTAPAFASCTDFLPPSGTSQFFNVHSIGGGQSPRRDHEYARGVLYPVAEASQAAFSVATGGVISESDEDPFRYDRNSYTLFLQRDREREVSVALERIESSSVPSPSKEPAPNNRESMPPKRTPFATSPLQVNLQTNRRPLQSNNPFLNRLDFYHTPSTEDGWEELDDPNEIKITVQPLSATPALKSPEILQGGTPTPGWKNKIYSEGLQNIVTDGGDWETVGTDVGHFDSNQACASGTGLSGSHLIKVAGSSIADYSDTSDFVSPAFNAFASTERILQHPTADCGPGKRVLRNLKDSGRPIFLPKPRIHRVNGYPQDSCRIFTDPTAASSGSSASSHLLDKLKFSKRLRRQNETTQEPRHNPYRAIREPSMHSLSETWSLDDAAKGYPTKGKGQDITVDFQVRSRARANTTDQAVAHKRAAAEAPTANKDNRITPIQAGRSPATGSPTLFSFPLITLEEAAKKQAIRVANGEDDLTITSGCRTRQDSCAMSSRATQRTTPPTPCIRKPTPVHYRNHTGLGLQDAVAHYPGYSLDHAFGGHGHDTSIVSALSSASPPIPGRAVFPRSCRNPFGFSRGSIRSSFSFPNRPPAFSIPRTQETPVRVQDAKQGKKQGKIKKYLLQRDTGPHLPRIVDEETAASFNLEIDNAHLSWDARRKRQICYYIALATCIFPFMAVLVYKGAFNSALCWYTKGEVGRLTHRQRRNIGVLGSTIAALWLVVTAVVVTLLVSRR